MDIETCTNHLYTAVSIATCMKKLTFKVTGTYLHPMPIFTQDMWHLNQYLQDKCNFHTVFVPRHPYMYIFLQRNIKYKITVTRWINSQLHFQSMQQNYCMKNNLFATTVLVFKASRVTKPLTELMCRKGSTQRQVLYKGFTRDIQTIP